MLFNKQRRLNQKQKIKTRQRAVLSSNKIQTSNQNVRFPSSRINTAGGWWWGGAVRKERNLQSAQFTGVHKGVFLEIVDRQRGRLRLSDCSKRCSGTENRVVEFCLPWGLLGQRGVCCLPRKIIFLQQTMINSLSWWLDTVYFRTYPTMLSKHLEEGINIEIC